MNIVVEPEILAPKSLQEARDISFGVGIEASRVRRDSSPEELYETVQKLLIALSEVSLAIDAALQGV